MTKGCDLELNSTALAYHAQFAELDAHNSGQRRWPKSRSISLIMRTELDPENETVGQGGAVPLESADRAGVGPEADTKEAQRGI